MSAVIIAIIADTALKMIILVPPMKAIRPETTIMLMEGSSAVRILFLGLTGLLGGSSISISFVFTFKRILVFRVNAG